MNNEEYKKYCDMIENMYYAGVISQSTKNYCENEAYQKNKIYNGNIDYWSGRIAISYKKKFDTSYWATVPPETSQDAPQISFTAESYDPTEIFPKPSNGLIWRGKIGKGVLDNRRGLNERN